MQTMMLGQLQDAGHSPPERALADPVRFMAYAMTYARHEDMKVIREYVPDADFREALDQAPPGIIDPRSWAYWTPRWAVIRRRRCQGDTLEMTWPRQHGQEAQAGALMQINYPQSSRGDTASGSGARGLARKARALKEVTITFEVRGAVFPKTMGGCYDLCSYTAPTTCVSSRAFSRKDDR